MPTSTEHAEAELDRLLRQAPSRIANASRNAHAGRVRHRRWEPARDALWDFLAPLPADGARVAIVGAGNCDTVPLRRIARRAGDVILLDIDPRAAQGARRRLGRTERRKVEVIGHDITKGVADATILAAVDLAAGSGDAVDLGPAPDDAVAPHDPLPGAPYDLVVGDLFYSQLLYPALRDLGVDAERIDVAIADHAPALTRATVARLHASAPLVVHIHDPLGWWAGHEPPVSIEQILDLAERDGAEAALALVAHGSGPRESDPRPALADLGLAPTTTALWRWPFAEGVDYLACATLAGSTGAAGPHPPGA